jgi:HEPN domain-containing protein
MKAQAFADVVRESQEVVELLLKGALRFVGVDPPKRHDVRAVMLRVIQRFPPELRRELREIAVAASRLAEDRGRAFYGDEDAMVDASELFGVDDARSAVAVVDRALALSARLMGEP